MYSWKSVLITIGLLFTLKIWNPMFIENISWSWFDYLHSTHSVQEYDSESGLPEIVLVDIDEKSVEEFGQFRPKMGHLPLSERVLWVGETLKTQCGGLQGCSVPSLY